MGKVRGVKEKLQYPIYDAFFVPGKTNGTEKTFGQLMRERGDERMIRFFVDVQNKTKLETNLQASATLPSLNTFEARAMRVVVSHIDPKIDPKTGKPANPADADFLAELIYTSVTTLLVGEKIMIEVPTFYFPSGSGVSPGNGSVTNHGEPDPMATFRFAEPVIIEPQQNFRVEMMFPQGVSGQGTTPTPMTLAGTKGPLRVWVVMDGYLTRDVQ